MVNQEGYISELVASEDLKRPVKTPATADLFEVDPDSPRLDKHGSENFHSVTAKLLFASEQEDSSRNLCGCIVSDFKSPRVH